MYKIICDHCGDEIKFEDGPSFAVLDAKRDYAMYPEDPAKEFPIGFIYCKCGKTCILRFKREE